MESALTASVERLRRCEVTARGGSRRDASWCFARSSAPARLLRAVLTTRRTTTSSSHLTRQLGPPIHRTTGRLRRGAPELSLAVRPPAHPELRHLHHRVVVRGR